MIVIITILLVIIVLLQFVIMRRQAASHKYLGDALNAILINQANQMRKS